MRNSKNETAPIGAPGPDRDRSLKNRQQLHCLPAIVHVSEDSRIGSLKEVIQPQVPLRLPCYDFTPIIGKTVGASFPKVRLATLGPANFRGVTGGVYKARERIHRGMLIRDY
jgi:hypothetical protein